MAVRLRFQNILRKSASKNLGKIVLQPYVQGNHAILKLLLDAGGSTAATTKQGFTAVHLSAFAGSIELLRELKIYNADLDCIARNGLTPIHLAAQTGAHGVVKYLLEEGCVFGETRSGCTVLHVAAHHGHEDVVRVLLTVATPGLSFNKWRFILRLSRIFSKFRTFQKFF